MSAVRVLVDGVVLATVNTSGYDVVSVHVHGTRTDDEFATLEMNGGTYPERAESSHLIWINNHELRPGQEIEVRFQEAGETSPRGKTIDELFPEEAANAEPIDFKPTAAMFKELRSKPQRRDGFSLRLTGSSGASFAGQTAAADYGFGFSLVWNSHRPDRASHSLHTYTLDELESGTPMRDFVREHVHAPYAIALRVDA